MSALIHEDVWVLVQGRRQHTRMQTFVVLLLKRSAGSHTGAILPFQTVDDRNGLVDGETRSEAFGGIVAVAVTHSWIKSCDMIF